ncbi:MAG: hypothetical protein SNH88_01880 [Rikenellaceae bacterium]
MGRSYKIRCRHCGAQFDHCADNSYGILQRCVGCGDMESDDSSPIFCPACSQRVNSSKMELESQIEEIITWQ